MRPTAPLVIALVCGLAACDRLPASQDAPAAGAVVSAGAPAGGQSASAGAAVDPVSGAARPAALAQIQTQQRPILDQPARAAKPRLPGIHTPAPGSPDRTAMMDSLRAVVRPDIGGDIVFVVRELRSNGTWAFAVLEPTRPNGRPIVLNDTPIYKRSDADLLDGLRTEAIWRKEGGVWRVEAHAIGATDVWWTDHCGRVPDGVLTGC
jgi:hypothetical protein